MSSELHELIEKELAAADNRIEKGAGAGGAVRVHSLQVEAARRKNASEGKSLEDKARAALAYATDVAKLWFGRAKLSYAEHPQRWRVAAAVAFVIFVVSLAAGGGGELGAGVSVKPGGHGAEDSAAEMHYMRLRQGLDPAAIPSLAIVGVSKAGTTDLYRRLLARYPSLQPGPYREMRFLTECQTDQTTVLDYRAAHRNCSESAELGGGDPNCHLCGIRGYASVFNTSAVRARLGGCPLPLSQQALCAGGALKADRSGREAAAAGYHPTFTVDASNQYSGSPRLAMRAAAVLAAVSPGTKLVLMLRSPADIGRALFNAHLTSECGTAQCGPGSGHEPEVPAYETLIARELAYLNTSAARAQLAALLAASNGTAAAGRDALEALEAGWVKHWESHSAAWGAGPKLFNHSALGVLYSLAGVYAPLLNAWTEKFVTPGTPLLVVHSEGYFTHAPQLIDDLFGSFLFGDSEGVGAFAAPGGGLGQPALRRYGQKASQSRAQRCELWELLRDFNAALYERLAALQKAGKVQVGGRSESTGKLWPKPAECYAGAGGNVTGANDYDYAEGDYISSQPASFEVDYEGDYGSVKELPTNFSK